LCWFCFRFGYVRFFIVIVFVFFVAAIGVRDRRLTVGRGGRYRRFPG
jgi:hypothetical protein